MKKFFLLLLASVATPAAAQHLHTCRDWQGNTTVQDQPCPPTTREVKRIPFNEHVPTTSAVAAKQQSIDMARALQDAGFYGRTTASQGNKPWDPRNPGYNVCGVARGQRDAFLKAHGFAATIETRQALNRMVYDHCR